MRPDIFGDLMDWGQVLEMLRELKTSRQLDEHQPGLARILRYRKNWKLMETVLTCSTDISQASDVLITEVLEILAAGDVYLQARVLAARALGHLIPRRPPQDPSTLDMDRVLRTMTGVLKGPEAPVLQRAVAEALAEARTPPVEL